MIDRPALIARLIAHEGLRLFPYTDTAGKITIGVGRNLSDKGISGAEAQYLLSNDIDEFLAEVTARVPVFVKLDPVRQGVLIEVAFNVGVDGLLGFHVMLDCLARKDFAKAGLALVDSEAARQTGQRYIELADTLSTGVVSV